MRGNNSTAKYCQDTRNRHFSGLISQESLTLRLISQKDTSNHGGTH